MTTSPATPVVPVKGDTQDPSALTTQMILREVAHAQSVIEERLNGYDKAIELLQRYPTEVDRAIRQLKELHEEKFVSVEKQFTASDKAVTTAFASAKEAVAKSESNTGEQLRSIDARITDIKDRVISMESLKKGSDSTWAVVAGLIFLGLAVLGSVITVVAFAAK